MKNLPLFIATAHRFVLFGVIALGLVTVSSICAEDDLSLENELAEESKTAPVTPEKTRRSDKTTSDAERTDDEARPRPKKSADDLDLEQFLEEGAASGDKLMEQLNKAIGTIGRARQALSDPQSEPKNRTATALAPQAEAVADLDELIRLMEEEMNQPPPPPNPSGGGGGGEQSDQQQGGAADQPRSSGGKGGQGKGSSSRKRKSLADLARGGGGQALARGQSRSQPKGRTSSGAKPGDQLAGSRRDSRAPTGRENPNPNDSTEGVRKPGGAGGAEDPKDRLAKDVWGHLPPQLREELLNVYTEKYLPKYEDLVRTYYEALAEQTRNRPSGEEPRRGRK